MSKFKIGDKVVVVNTGKVFTTYHKMAELMELDKYDYGYSPENGCAGVVSAKSYHEDAEQYGVLYGVCGGHNQFIIGESGLELYKEPVEVPPTKNVTFPFFYQHKDGEEVNSGFAYIDSEGRFNVLCKGGNIAPHWLKEDAIRFIQMGLWIPQEYPILPDEFWFQYNGYDGVFYKVYVNDVTNRLHIYDVKDKFITDYSMNNVVNYLKEGIWSIVEEPQQYIRRKEIMEQIQELQDELGNLE